MHVNVHACMHAAVHAGCCACEILHDSHYAFADREVIMVMRHHVQSISILIMLVMLRRRDRGLVVLVREANHISLSEMIMTLVTIRWSV
jgi:hypothetical protein